MSIKKRTYSSYDEKDDDHDFLTSGDHEVKRKLLRAFAMQDRDSNGKNAR